MIFYEDTWLIMALPRSSLQMKVTGQSSSLTDATFSRQLYYRSSGTDFIVDYDGQYI